MYMYVINNKVISSWSFLFFPLWLSWSFSLWVQCLRVIIRTLCKHIFVCFDSLLDAKYKDAKYKDAKYRDIRYKRGAMAKEQAGEPALKPKEDPEKQAKERSRARPKKVSIMAVIFCLCITLIDCASMRAANFVASRAGLVEIPAKIRGNRNGIPKRVILDEFDMKNIKVKRSRDLLGSSREGRLSIEIESLFELVFIVNSADSATPIQDAIFGSTRFVYRKEGADINKVESAVFKARISQDTRPYTMTLLPDPMSLIMYGKIKSDTRLFDIEGYSFRREKVRSEVRETGFFIKDKGKIIGYVEFPGKMKFYILPNLPEDARKTVEFALVFLANYSRPKEFIIDEDLIRNDFL